MRWSGCAIRPGSASGPAPSATARSSRANRAAARRRRLWRRQPRRARLCAADVARALSHPARPSPWPCRLHQQAALRRLPRLRQCRRSTFAGETQLDEIAEQLGLDPIELRRQQHACARANTGSAASAIDSNGLAECVAAVRARIELGPPPALAAGARGQAAGLRRRAGGAHQRPARDRGDRAAAGGRRVVLNTGAVDIGQGSDTVLTQICAEALQVPIERVALASARHRWLALQLGHHRQPCDLHHRPLRGRRPARGRAASSRSMPPRCSNAARPISSCGPAARSASTACPARQRARSWRSRRARMGAPAGRSSAAHSWVFDQPTLDPKRATALGCRSSRSASSASARWSWRWKSTRRPASARAAAPGRRRRRPGHQPAAGQRPDRGRASCRAWASHWSRKWCGTAPGSPTPA